MGKTTAIMLAVFLGIFTWIYTWRKDYWKFWTGLAIALLLSWTFVAPIGVWVWAMIDAIRRPGKFYKQFE
jgi:hypothetical protein